MQEVNKSVPDIVISRLPVYLQILNQLLRQGEEIISSKELASRLGITDTQIRKDLSYFGGFGTQGKGYPIIHLIEELRHILNLNQIWQVVLLGVGNLGQALLSYQGFTRKGFEIVLAFDTHTDLIGRKISGVVVRDVRTLEEEVKKQNLKIAILTVPAAEAQELASRLVNCGIKAILNYAPVTIKTPPDVRVQDIDPILKLQNLTYFLRD